MPPGESHGLRGSALGGGRAEDVLTQLVSADGTLRETLDSERVTRWDGALALDPLADGLGGDSEGASQGSLVADDHDGSGNGVHRDRVKRRFNSVKRRFIPSAVNLRHHQAMLAPGELAQRI